MLDNYMSRSRANRRLVVVDAHFTAELEAVQV